MSHRPQPGIAQPAPPEVLARDLPLAVEPATFLALLEAAAESGDPPA